MEGRLLGIVPGVDVANVGVALGSQVRDAVGPTDSAHVGVALGSQV